MNKSIEFIGNGKVSINESFYHELTREIIFLRQKESDTRKEALSLKSSIELLERENERLYNILSQVTKTSV